MSQEERTGTRDLAYSSWHRARSVMQYYDGDDAARYQVAVKLKTVDIDWCECCYWCSEPLALIETQHSSAPPKSATITALLAKRAGINAYSVSYETDETGAMSLFQVRCIQPYDRGVSRMLPQVYAYWLRALRYGHISTFHADIHAAI